MYFVRKFSIKLKFCRNCMENSFKIANFLKKVENCLHDFKKLFIIKKF